MKRANVVVKSGGKGELQEGKVRTQTLRSVDLLVSEPGNFCTYPYQTKFLTIVNFYASRVL